MKVKNRKKNIKFIWSVLSGIYQYKNEIIFLCNELIKMFG